MEYTLHQDFLLVMCLFCSSYTKQRNKHNEWKTVFSVRRTSPQARFFKICNIFLNNNEKSPHGKTEHI